MKIQKGAGLILDIELLDKFEIEYKNEYLFELFKI